MTVGAIALSFATIALDWVVQERLLRKIQFIWIGGTEGARQLLSTIAGSMITVAGVVFSITIVVLTLASSQFGPRLLRNFMRDRGNQVVLGTFIATFTYCLLVLRSIHGDGGPTFVPYISVTLGIVLSLLSVAVLIYFIHHVSVIIQAPAVIAMVSAELEEVIERLFPEKLGKAPVVPLYPPIPKDFDSNAEPITALDTGYLQAIDNDSLLKLAVENDLLVKVNYRPGQFVIAGNPLLRAWPRERVSKESGSQFNEAFVLGSSRTPTQDVEFCIDQLVEVAVRALSPGVNDPFTAVNCVDRLGAALCQLSERDIPSAYRFDEKNRLRVIAYPVSFADLSDAAFNQIRQYGRSSVAVTIRLLETLLVIARRVRREGDLEALLRQATMIQRGSQALGEVWDRQAVTERYRAVRACLECAPASRQVKL